MLLSKSSPAIYLLVLGLMLSLSSCGIFHQSQKVTPEAVKAKAEEAKKSDNKVSTKEQAERAPSSRSQDSARAPLEEGKVALPSTPANEDLFPANALPPVNRSGLRTPSLPFTLPMDLDGRLVPQGAQ